jgi:D-alanyl-D-alanine carboxypeptidase
MTKRTFILPKLVRILPLVAMLLTLGQLRVGVGMAPARADGPDNGDLAATVDTIMTEYYKPDRPGAAVIVVKDEHVVFRKGYGMANMELGVPIRPDMVFRLGSITKQFTAVSILMLAEQGKLSVADDITKYLPDYPTQGHKITIENLLTHTSGVKNYTALPTFGSQMRKDMSLTELIGLFKDQPMDFAPGEKWSYSNSGYILLGAIIEKISGQSYEDFVQSHIFVPLGMTHTFYDHTDRLIPGRVSGYSKRPGADGKETFVNCPYLSMTLPYAAGSLASSVDDLALWDQALYTEKLVKQESLKKAWTAFQLNSGKPTTYGYGWGINTLDGHAVISHDGGINGFATSEMRVPDIHGFIAVLTNLDSGSGPGGAVEKIALAMLGHPYQEPTAIELPADTLDRYVGKYKLEGGPTLTVTRSGNKLLVRLGTQLEFIPVSDTEFFSKGRTERIIFVRDTSGAITGLRIHSEIGEDTVATKEAK